MNTAIAREKNLSGRLSGRNPFSHPLVGVLPLLLLPAIVFSLREALPAWVFMWAMAMALFAGCKWLTYRTAGVRTSIPDIKRSLGFFLAWPGMDAAAFLSRAKVTERPRQREW